MRFEIQVEAKDLFRFNMYHIYHTFSGVLGMVISIAALVGAVLTYGTVNTTYTVALLLVGCMYTLIHPFSVYSKCKATAKSKTYAQPFEYVFGEDGFSVTQGDQHVDYKWESIARVKKAGSNIMIYMDKIHAHILPAEKLDGRAQELLTFIGEHTAGRGTAQR
jgi:hypothetical protein